MTELNNELFCEGTDKVIKVLMVIDKNLFISIYIH